MGSVGRGKVSGFCTVKGGEDYCSAECMCSVRQGSVGMEGCGQVGRW